MINDSSGHFPSAPRHWVLFRFCCVAVEFGTVNADTHCEASGLGHGRDEEV